MHTPISQDATNDSDPRTLATNSDGVIPGGPHPLKLILVAVALVTLLGVSACGEASGAGGNGGSGGGGGAPKLLNILLRLGGASISLR
jgi:hypothetical protein